jgi:electron transfer flavoprotein beta subunit
MMRSRDAKKFCISKRTTLYIPVVRTPRPDEMTMQIIVPIKQVPDPEHFDKIAVDFHTGSINRMEIPSITNPLDRHALEEALLMKEQFGGEVYALTMGPPQARRAIEDALAMGADKGAILNDPLFAGSDTLATARVLSAGIRRLGRFDLVICGNDTVDGATGQVPVQLAEFLNVPHVTHVRKVDVIGVDRVMVERSIEGGYLRIELRLPAVISVLKSINKYRLPTVSGIVEAAEKEIIELDASLCKEFGITDNDLGVNGSPTKVFEVYESSLRRDIEIITGEPTDVAKKLVRRLRKLEAI